MRLLWCFYNAGSTALAATTNQRRPSRMHDIWKFQAKLPFLWICSHWYQLLEFPWLLTITTGSHLIMHRT